MAPGIALGQAIGRWGNWANQEAFGRLTDLPWGVAIDPPHRPAAYAGTTQFQPTFLYESLVDLLITAVLAWLAVRLPRDPRWREGDGSWLYLISYGVGRFIPLGQCGASGGGGARADRATCVGHNTPAGYEKRVLPASS